MKKILFFFSVKEDEERLINVSKLLLLNMIKKDVKYFKIEKKNQLLELEKFISLSTLVLEKHLSSQTNQKTTILLTLLFHITDSNIFKES